MQRALQSGAKVDWLTVTFKPEDPSIHVGWTILEWLRGLLMDRTGKRVGVVAESCSGMRGYEYAVRIYAFVALNDGMSRINIGRVDWGGAFHGGRARFDLSGSGCALICNWHALQSEISNWDEYKLTRVDLAVDCLNGEFTLDHAVDWYRSGSFNAGGRMPRHSTIGDWLTDTPQYGRTLQIGQRGNGKMCRVYEKGRQLGDPSSDWVRFEVEIRNKDRDIPLEILTDCDTYFTGAYNCLFQVLQVAGTRIATHQKEGLISLARLVSFAKTAYGGTVHVMRGCLTADEIIDHLARPVLPARLDKASIAGFSNLASVLPKLE